MDYNNVYTEIEKLKDEKESVKMAAYMRNLFPYLGVPTPKRKSACKEFFKTARKEKEVDWEFVYKCWENEYREMQYVAMDYLSIVQKCFLTEDIEKVKKLAQTKSWWDTIDGLDKIAGSIELLYPQVANTLLEWSVDDDFWLRRIAIDFQLTRKENTNTQLLEKILIANLESKEFFINKAIGWSLRDYSKTNPEWVRNFVSKHRDKMATLSIKEASKYL